MIAWCSNLEWKMISHVNFWASKDRYLLSFNIFPVVPKIGKWIHRHKNFLLVSLSLIHRAGNFRSWVNPRIFWWGVGVGKSENYDSGSLFSTLELKKNPEIIQGDLTLNTSYRVIEFDLVVVKSWCWTRSGKKPLNQLLRTPLQTRDHPQKCSEAPGRLSNVFRCDRVHNDSTLRIKMSIGRSKFKATTLLNHWSQSSGEKTDHNRKMKWKKG